METLWRFINENEGVIMGGTLIILLTYLSTRWPVISEKSGEYITPRGYRRRGAMLRRTQEEFAFNLLLNDFTDRIETRYINGEINKKNRAEIYRRLRRSFPRIRDIFPAPEPLKEKIKNRLGKHIEASFPDEKPKYKRKHVLDTGPERVTL